MKLLLVSQMSVEIFLACGFEVDVVNVGQGAQPGEDIGEFFLFVFLVVAGQSGG